MQTLPCHTSHLLLSYFSAFTPKTSSSLILPWAHSILTIISLLLYQWSVLNMWVNLKVKVYASHFLKNFPHLVIRVPLAVIYLFFQILLRHNWHTALYKFKGVHHNDFIFIRRKMITTINLVNEHLLSHRCKWKEKWLFFHCGESS